MDAGNKIKRTDNPRETANYLSALTFWWTLPIFLRCYKKELVMDDLPKTLKTHQSARLADKLTIAWEKEIAKINTKCKGKPSLLRALIRVFGAEIMMYGLILAVFKIGIRLTQPLALGQLIGYFKKNQTEISLNSAYLYAGAIIGTSFINILVHNAYMMASYHMGMKLRVSCCSLIYRKSLRLSESALRETTVGQIVNLLSNDVNRFDLSVSCFHHIWIGTLEAIVVMYYIYQEVGAPAILGVIFMMSLIPLQVYVGKRSSFLRLKTAIRTDERVRLMNEVISGMQVIKMYTWEKPFAALIALARRNELKAIKTALYNRGINLSFSLFASRVAIFISVLAYILLGIAITAPKLFIIIAYYNLLNETITVFGAMGITYISEALVSINRLQKFLMHEETQPAVEKHVVEIQNSAVMSNSIALEGIVLKNITAKWTRKLTDNTLNNINITVRPGRLTTVIGPVGSGKSSLLHVILKELPVIAGTITVTGEISYSSQEPWIFQGSVQQNILFGLPFDEKRYKKIVGLCALERDLTLFPYGDKTIIGERGVSLSGGQRARINLARAVYKDADIYLLDDPLSAVDTLVGKELFEKCISGYLKEKTVILITHQLQYLKEVDHIVILNNGAMQAEGHYNKLKETGLDFAQLLEEQAEPKAVELEDTKTIRVRQDSIQSVATVEKKISEEPIDVQEQRTKGSITFEVYRTYITGGRNYCLVFVIFIMFVIGQLAGSSGDFFITYWVSLEENRMLKYNDTISATDSESFWEFSRNTCIYISTVIISATVVILLTRPMLFLHACVRSSKQLHDTMFNSISRATMRFFNTNNSGRILNRFSTDMGAIDEMLPATLFDVLHATLQLLSMIILVSCIKPILLVPTILLLAIAYFLRMLYLSTGRSVKRLEGISRSPVFGHITASLQGLTTIRAFKVQVILEEEFDNHQDLHSSAWFLFCALSRAFGFSVDLLCIVYITIVTLSFLVFSNYEESSNIGLAITQSLLIATICQWGMKQSAELENQMTAVERVLEFSKLEQESSFESADDKKPPKSWPERGCIQFQGVYLRYAPEEPPVLRDLNFTIEPKDKIGVVGRTGAGKSSLIAALFQLVRTKGHILIDGRNIKQLGLHDLRSKISIIPQEPVLFSGTLRSNLDPFNEYTDHTLWGALDQVEMKQTISDLAGGLNSKMSERGSNFSVGQRQLVCLARAIVRRNKILLLDEATANVDPHTDALIQHTIRIKFAKCTVITIAHRLQTIMDMNRVLVMDAGTMVEFNHPHLLLQNSSGFLYQLVQRTGSSMTKNLMRIAEDAFRVNSKDKISSIGC